MACEGFIRCCFGGPWCGPKCAAFGMVISLWGIIMFIALGVLFRVRQPTFSDDIMTDSAKVIWQNATWDYKYAIELYNNASTAALISAACYVLLLAFTCSQYIWGSRIDQRKKDAAAAARRQANANADSTEGGGHQSLSRNGSIGGPGSARMHSLGNGLGKGGAIGDEGL